MSTDLSIRRNYKHFELPRISRNCGVHIGMVSWVEIQVLTCLVWSQFCQKKISVFFLSHLIFCQNIGFPAVVWSPSSSVIGSYTDATSLVQSDHEFSGWNSKIMIESIHTAFLTRLEWLPLGQGLASNNNLQTKISKFLCLSHILFNDSHCVDVDTKVMYCKEGWEQEFQK